MVQIFIINEIKCIFDYYWYKYLSANISSLQKWYSSLPRCTLPKKKFDFRVDGLGIQGMQIPWREQVKKRLGQQQKKEGEKEQGLHAARAMLQLPPL